MKSIPTSSRVAVIHVPYQVPGGEEVYVQLLTRAYERLGMKAQVFPGGEQSRGDLIEMFQSINPMAHLDENLFLIDGRKPDLMHLNHVYPRLGLIPYRWAMKYQVPVIMTVHNHRFYCTNGLALRGGSVCTDCRDTKIPWRSIIHNCNDSLKKSTYYSLALSMVNLMNPGGRSLSRLIAPSPYVRDELIRFGVASGKIQEILHPVDVPISNQKTSSDSIGFDVFYAGRLSTEKGIEVLMRAAELAPDLRFGITGAGPLSQEVSQFAARSKNFHYLGKIERAEVMKIIRNSQIGIMPSICYESFGFFAAECFWFGKRCVVSNLQSSHWMTHSSFLAVESDTTKPEALVQTIREAIKMPQVPETQVAEIRQKLSFDRFCDELGTTARQVMSIPEKPKVLVLHVPYEHRGGEDIHVDTLVEAYKMIGYEPIVYPEVRRQQRTGFLRAFGSLTHSPEIADLESYWNRVKPAFIHAHNIYPRLGPSFYRWASRRKIPLVMTIHNHRFFCTNGLALRDGKICRDCFDSKISWRPIVYNCNQQFTKSSYYAIALTEARLGDLHKRAVQHFIAPSPYIQNELVRGGIDPAKISCLLNPISIDGSEINDPEVPAFDVLYAGRLSTEKGIRQLIETAKKMPDCKFGIAGSGPEKIAIMDAAKTHPNIHYLGFVPHERVMQLIKKTRVAVLPSICNEVLPTFVLESFMQGKRCVVPALDSTSWLVSDLLPGHTASTENPDDIVRAIRDALAAPAPTEEQTLKMRKMFGLDRFCQELKVMADGMLPPPPPPLADHQTPLRLQSAEV